VVVMTWSTFKLKAGNYLYKQNDDAEFVYFLKSGKIEIEKQIQSGDILTVGTVNNSEIFGESSVFGTMKRSVSTLVIEDREISYIPIEYVKNMVSDIPIVDLIIRNLEKRIGKFNEDYVSDHSIGERGFCNRERNFDSFHSKAIIESGNSIANTVMGNKKFVYDENQINISGRNDIKKLRFDNKNLNIPCGEFEIPYEFKINIEKHNLKYCINTANSNNIYLINDDVLNNKKALHYLRNRYNVVDIGEGSKMISLFIYIS
jgi:hypothetical protein